jgi:hypothetical protein
LGVPDSRLFGSQGARTFEQEFQLKDWMNAASLCIIGCIIALSLREGTNKNKNEGGIVHTAHAEASVTSPDRPATLTRVFGSEHEAVRVDEPDEEIEYMPTRQNPICAPYDVVEHPEQILDLLMLASAKSCRTVRDQKVCAPVDILYAIWRVETGSVDGNGLGSGDYPVMKELKRRDGDKRTHHGEGMLRMADHFGWKQVYGNGLEKMKCSPPTTVPVFDPVTGEKIGKKTRGYGGCCGPFQFSGGEVADWAIKQDLDPLTFCGGALIAGQDMVKRYESAIKDGHEHGVPAWRRAISSYYGGDPKLKYYLKALGRWEAFDAWQACRVEQASNGTQTWVRKSTGEACDEAALNRQWDFVRSRIIAQSMGSIRYHRERRR